MRKSIDQRVANEQVVMLILAIILCATALWAIGCGGGGGGSTTGGTTTPTPTTSGAVGATITITSAGVSASTPRVATGERVRFTNNDSSVHQILSTPHLIHNDCPALNSIGSIAPGQSGTSEPLTTMGGCGFHDHLNPDNNNFRGQVLVGLGSGDPTPPTPGY